MDIKRGIDKAVEHVIEKLKTTSKKLKQMKKLHKLEQSPLMEKNL